MRWVSAVIRVINEEDIEILAATWVVPGNFDPDNISCVAIFVGLRDIDRKTEVFARVRSITIDGASRIVARVCR